MPPGPGVGRITSDELEKAFVNEIGGLERVPLPLTPKQMLGRPVQVSVDEGHQLRLGGGVAASSSLEQRRHGTSLQGLDSRRL